MVRRPEGLSRIAEDRPRRPFVVVAFAKEFRPSVGQLRVKFGQKRE